MGNQVDGGSRMAGMGEGTARLGKAGTGPERRMAEEQGKGTLMAAETGG